MKVSEDINYKTIKRQTCCVLDRALRSGKMYNCGMSALYTGRRLVVFNHRELFNSFLG